ncbi:GDSL esterase/lipase At1g71250 [Dendrobium catenatum]|uniref:GDSL esterase/lipase At1g71250 n=1 Tax=Dendrobium catenatum TaxID=906689 RepID=UPI0009F561D1|nr:GDSL esterase/lipase At1g71250 [Dendrobium catenatum]
MANSIASSPQLPAMFVFGDSLVDSGNNNYLTSIAKANYYPYGIDFSQGITGRFTNGKTTVDALCDRLGLSYLPPYTMPGLNGTQILGGVNYASAAAGILDESGQYLGERFPLSQQVINFENNLYELRAMLGEKMSDYLAKSIVVMVFGSNDYINNYLLPSLYTTSYNNYTAEQFASLLINSYTRQILALHSLGLRKFLLAAVGPIGCTPNQRSFWNGPPDRCNDQVNEIVDFFNRGLRSEVDQLNNNHPGAIFVYGNTYGAIGDVLNNPANYGMRIVDRGCCGIDMGRGVEITCLPYLTPCGNRNEYVFWDAYHPTTAVNLILAQKAYAGPPTDCYPINVQQMVQI